MRRLLQWLEPSGLASRRIMRELKLRDPEAWRFIVEEDESELITRPQTSGATTTVNLPRVVQNTTPSLIGGVDAVKRQDTAS